MKTDQPTPLSTKIEPRILKGFRDSLPAEESRRRQVLATLEKSFAGFGFVPIDTPVLEYADILLGKGGGETDKQVYRFTDHGGRDVALRFDLTVPFARFMAGHHNELGLPFKRYHIGKVFRGENTQRGRFREFYQCDFDTVGTDSWSADLDILLCIIRSLEAIGLSDFHLEVAHRGLFNDFLAGRRLLEKSVDILRTVDKLSKIGRDKVGAELRELAGPAMTDDILEFISPENDAYRQLEKLIRLTGGESEASGRLQRVFAAAADLGLTDIIRLDSSITRGLDYYTGIVFETQLDAAPDIGSICSGGRYNNLAGLYTKTFIPGVGASIGIDRLLAALIEDEPAAPAAELDAMVFCLDEAYVSYYHALADRLRTAGLRVDVYPKADKMGKQFNYAERRGSPIAFICGEDEIGTGTVTIKDLRSRQSRKVDHSDDLDAEVRSIINQNKLQG